MSFAARPLDLGAAVAMAAVSAVLFAGTVSREPRALHSSGLALRKEDAGDLTARPPLLGTLVQTHTDERLLLDEGSPTPTRFDALLADRATGTTQSLDPRLLDLLRTLAKGYASADGGAGAPRVELVSGFRSPKLNEMMRKKGHHVASHSQHSLGHAVDFRIVVPCSREPEERAKEPECAEADAVALDPRVVERAIRASGWDGGVGVYTGKDDWFVHADVGPERSWFEGPRGPETGGMPRSAER